ncbi:MAG TPA: hypothetical protein VIM69_07300 [Opitutaceae bacterium]
MKPLEPLQAPQPGAVLFANTRRLLPLLRLPVMTILVLGLSLGRAAAADKYPNMAPLEQYLMPRDSEIALARSAAPESISRDAEVLILGPRGFEVATTGHNGFVCVVSRSWFSPIDDPQFWNPKERGPICYNAAAAHYFVPLLRKKTELVLSGKSKAELEKEIKASLVAGELPRLGDSAMCFMMSREAYLNDNGGHWHPHLMFFARAEPAASWGADLPGSPVFSSIDELDHVTTFMVPVSHWSDGSIDSH